MQNNINVRTFRTGGGVGNSFLFSTKSSNFNVADIIISLRENPRCKQKQIRNDNGRKEMKNAQLP